MPDSIHPFQDQLSSRVSLAPASQEHQEIHSIDSMHRAKSTAASIYGGIANLASPGSVISRPSSFPGTGITEEKTVKWSTALQTMLDQPPAAFPRRLMLGGIAFCMAFGAWATLGQIDEIGKAQGQLVPKGNVYKIHSVQSGKIVDIEVEEGESVQAGQVLVELDTELAATEVERLEQLLNSQQTELTQKEALMERTGLEAQTRQQIVQADVQAQQAALAQAQARVTVLKQKLPQVKAEKAFHQQRQQRLKSLTAHADELLVRRQVEAEAQAERLKNLKPLLEEGAISKEIVFQAEQSLRASQSAIVQSQLQEGTNTQEQVFQSQQTLRDLDLQMIQTQGELQQTLAEIDQLQAGLAQKQSEVNRSQLESQERMQQLEMELTQLKAKIADNENQLARAKAQLNQQFLYAPVDGVVSSLNVSNQGEVVQPSQTIAEMAPEGEPLVLSASLPNRDAGFVKVGMPVKVKLDAYPYQDYGIVTGEITSISPDAKPHEQFGAVYQVEVELDRNHIKDKGRLIEFKAGQTATAEIIIRRRRIADILLEPFRGLKEGGISL
ncbi:MAG: HlyD family efflux transporter periplasmic adaptor subunit [Coleofasciculus sp. G3-WIS-01]|uniref:HlyD family efflux transporter periplasmic adaptor subunit n=1 Tax=Coleofasciculus sp. G3-WIS-01 TaxID=3069528 RepID=UPI0032F2B9EA